MAIANLPLGYPLNFDQRRDKALGPLTVQLLFRYPPTTSDRRTIHADINRDPPRGGSIMLTRVLGLGSE